MSGDRTGKGSNPFHNSFVTKFLLYPFGLLFRLWTFSIRFEYKSQNGKTELENHQDPIILFLWHNRLFLAGEWHSRFRKNKTCYGLISASRDGAWLETFYGWAGIKAIRGSQNRRGAQAVRELIKVIKSGNDVGVTPDGSRGPRYKPKQGAVVLARIAKQPLLLLSFQYSHCIKLKSWDEFVIPYPFSKVIVRTRLLYPGELFDRDDEYKAVEYAQKALMEMTFDK